MTETLASDRFPRRSFIICMLCPSVYLSCDITSLELQARELIRVIARVLRGASRATIHEVLWVHQVSFYYLWVLKRGY